MQQSNVSCQFWFDIFLFEFLARQNFPSCFRSYTTLASCQCSETNVFGSKATESETAQQTPFGQIITQTFVWQWIERDLATKVFGFIAFWWRLCKYCDWQRSCEENNFIATTKLAHEIALSNVYPCFTHIFHNGMSVFSSISNYFSRYKSIQLEPWAFQVDNFSSFLCSLKISDIFQLFSLGRISHFLCGEF